MIFSDDWGEEPTQVERERPWMAADFAEIPTYRAPCAGRYDNDRPTFTELQAIGDCHEAS